MEQLNITENVKIYFWVIISILNPWYVNYFQMPPDETVMCTLKLFRVHRCTIILLSSRFYTMCVTLMSATIDKMPLHKKKKQLFLSFSENWIRGPAGSEDSKSLSMANSSGRVIALPHTLCAKFKLIQWQAACCWAVLIWQGACVNLTEKRH